MSGLLELGPLVLPLIGTLVGELLLPRAYVQRHSQMAQSSGEEQGDINCYSCHACQAESEVTSFGDYITCGSCVCSSPTTVGEEDRAADGIFLGTGSQHETSSPRHHTGPAARSHSWCCSQLPPTSTAQRESRQARSTLHDDSCPARSILEKYGEEESEDGEGGERRDGSAPGSSE